MPKTKTIWKSLLSPIGRGVAWVYRIQPLSDLGLLASIFSLLALRFFYVGSQDLVVGMLCGSTLFLVAVCALGTVYQRIRLGKTLHIEPQFDHQNPLSKTPIAAGMVVSGVRVLPFFTLELERHFDVSHFEKSAQKDTAARIISPKHLLRGRDPHDAKRRLVDSVRFPHRGLWAMSGVYCRIGDALGLTRLAWEYPLEAGIEVSAADIPIKALPIVAASSRAGDELSLSQERSGDLYDLKPYDPNDGVKRILWKTYAKSGQLVVRRPEPAMIPEGEVAIYLIAGREEDYVAGALQSYLKMLHENQIVVLFGTDGLNSIPHEHAGSPGETSYCSTPESIQRAINRSACSAQAGDGSDFEEFLESVEGPGRRIHQVVVFAPLETEGPASANKVLFPERYADRSIWLSNLQASTNKSHITLSLALVPDSFELHTDFIPTSGLQNLKRSVSAQISTMRKSAETNPAADLLSLPGAQVLPVERYE